MVPIQDRTWSMLSFQTNERPNCINGICIQTYYGFPCTVLERQHALGRRNLTQNVPLIIINIIILQHARLPLFKVVQKQCQDNHLVWLQTYKRARDRGTVNESTTTTRYSRDAPALAGNEQS
jgi:hypothetical protein